MNINQIKDLLSDRNLSEVARRTKLSHSTLRGIVKGRVTSPAPSTVELLNNYFASTCQACKD